MPWTIRTLQQETSRHRDHNLLVAALGFASTTGHHSPKDGFEPEYSQQVWKVQVHNIQLPAPIRKENMLLLQRQLRESTLQGSCAFAVGWAGDHDVTSLCLLIMCAPTLRDQFVRGSCVYIDIVCISYIHIYFEYT